MRVKRIVPPAAAPIRLKDLLHGLSGLFGSRRHIEKLKSQIREHFGVRHVFFVSSGKAALTLILAALKSVSDKRRVIIPAYTCFSVPSAIMKEGLEVVLCDIDLVTFDFDYDCLKKVVTHDTLCVIPHHLFGIPSDMDRLATICKEKGILVIEDAAQAMGGQHKGKLLGTIGDAGFFSLGRGKKITCGSGGIIVTNSDRIADSIARYYSNLKEPGIAEILKEFIQCFLMGVFLHPALYWFPSGMPFLRIGQTFFYKDFPINKLSGMKAALLQSWWSRLAQSNQTRAETAAYFIDRLQLETMHETPIPYLRLPILVESRKVRDRTCILSRKKGLGVSPMYPTPVNEIKEIKEHFNGKVFPSASIVAERLLTIPTHYFLSEKDKTSICELFDQAVLSELTPIRN